MKYLILALLLFLIFWYYKKKRISVRAKNSPLEVEMKPCSVCGVYFFPLEGYDLKKDSKVLFFCSNKCLKEYMDKREG